MRDATPRSLLKQSSGVGQLLGEERAALRSRLWPWDVRSRLYEDAQIPPGTASPCSQPLSPCWGDAGLSGWSSIPRPPPPTLTGVPMRNEDAPSHLPRQRRCLVPSSESRYRCCAGLPSRCPNGVLLCPGLLSPTSQLRGLLRVSSRSCSRQQRQLGGVWH